jgi:hypothetical protein
MRKIKINPKWNIRKIATFGENGLVIVDGTILRLIAGDSLNPETKWSKNIGAEVVALAGNDEFLVVADKSNKLTVYGVSGKRLCDFDLNTIPGGMKTTGAAVMDNYIYLTNEKGYGIVRLEFLK